jgi:enoyl-CoA hydratase/carnithine racemase
MSESKDTVLYRTEEGVALITLNRPDRLNAWIPEMVTRYFDLLDRAAADPDVRAIVVTGAGRGFCAGADVGALKDITEGEAEWAIDRPQIYALSIPKPIVCAVNGACAGLGLVHALMCDVRFAAAGAKFTTAFVRRGLIAEHGISWILPRLVGPSRALDLLLSGRVFLAEEAVEMGVVNRVLPAEEVLPAAIAYARDLAANCSPWSMATIKQQIYRHVALDVDAALADSNRLMQATLGSNDFREGVASYLEKRPPRFAPLQVGESSKPS